MSDYVLLSKSGRYNVELVGYHHYPDGQREVRDQARETNGSWDEPWFSEFQIIPEPDNPYDDHALSVRHRGVLVGYVPMEKNRAWWSTITNIVANKRTPVAKGKVEFWGSDPTFRVTLQMSNPKHAISGLNGRIPVQRGGHTVSGAYGKSLKVGRSTENSSQNAGCGTAAVLLMAMGLIIVAL